MNFNFDLYRTFCKVVECKNITKAAEELFVSQSAVTQSMQKLEKLLGQHVVLHTFVIVREGWRNQTKWLQD